MIHCSAFTRIGESNMTQIKKVGGSDRRTETEIIPYDGGASRRAFDLNHGRWLHWDGFEMLLLVMQMEDLALVSQSIVSFWFQINLKHLETLHIVLTLSIIACFCREDHCSIQVKDKRIKVKVKADQRNTLTEREKVKVKSVEGEPIVDRPHWRLGRLEQSHRVFKPEWSAGPI